MTFNFTTIFDKIRVSDLDLDLSYKIAYLKNRTAFYVDNFLEGPYSEYEGLDLMYELSIWLRDELIKHYPDVYPEDDDSKILYYFNGSKNNWEIIIYKLQK